MRDARFFGGATVGQLGSFRAGAPVFGRKLYVPESKAATAEPAPGWSNLSPDCERAYVFGWKQGVEARGRGIWVPPVSTNPRIDACYMAGFNDGKNGASFGSSVR